MYRFTMRNLFISASFFVFGFLACDRDVGLWKPEEHSPDSEVAKRHFSDLFGEPPPGQFSEIREYEQGGPMDQFFLMTFRYHDEGELQRLMSKSKFDLVVIDEALKKKREETANAIRTSGTSYEYDEVSQKLDASGVPDWWTKGPRIKAPIWFRKNVDAPWGYSYVWRDEKTKVAYVQTQ